jgi:predicted SnoaL-like aldol condensation-catalyzing enzyme
VDPKIEAATGFLHMMLNEDNVRGAFDKYVGDSYIQHNPRVPDGKDASIEALTQGFAARPAHSSIKRTFLDGDFAIVHHHVRPRDGSSSGSAVIDIFRFENGMIVEHWDVMQPVPEQSANDNTMF